LAINKTLPRGKQLAVFILFENDGARLITGVRFSLKADDMRAVLYILMINDSQK